MIETITLAGTVVGYIVKSIKENKDFKKLTSDFTSAAIDWIRPIFLKDDESSNEVLTDLIDSPDEKLYQEAAKLAIARNIMRAPENESKLKELVKLIQEKEGDLKAGYSVEQYHFGTGDNVGRDKKVN